MPAFVAVSGAVYWLIKVQLGKYRNHSKFIKNKTQRLIIPYFTTAIFLMLSLWVCEKIDDFPHYAISNILICGDVRHLWFLPMLFWTFIIFDLSHGWIIKNQIVCGILLIILNLISYYISLPFQIHSMMRYGIYFWVGYVYMENKDKLKILASPVFIVITLIVITGYALFLRWVPFGNRFFDIIIGTMGFLLTFTICSAVTNNSYVMRIIGKHSFSIYLFHVMIIYLFLWAIAAFALPAYLTAPIAILISIILSIIISISLEKLGISFLFGIKNK